MKKCPKCGCDTLFLSEEYGDVVDFNGKTIWDSNKIKAKCNDADCPQKFWFYPKAGTITKRGE